MQQGFEQDRKTHSQIDPPREDVDALYNNVEQNREDTVDTTKDAAKAMKIILKRGIKNTYKK